jgi:hypothetical protein
MVWFLYAIAGRKEIRLLTDEVRHEAKRMEPFVFDRQHRQQCLCSTRSMGIKSRGSHRACGAMAVACAAIPH